MTSTGRGARRSGTRIALGFALAAVALVGLTRGTQDAVANGDTRTLSLFQDHTKESAEITFKRNGSYDPEALKQLNWFLRDWRLDEQTRMDPRLFDIVWEVYREVGAREPIHVVSGYRSPETNAALRRRSRVVAEHSQHILGKAMDFYLPDASMSRVREIGMRLQDGGVGFYPNAFNPFVHLDAGSVRAWPRMSRGELARLFPDGKTVHIPRDGKPFEGYELAKADILSKGGSVAGYSTVAEAEDTGGRKSLWTLLFGGGDDEDSEFYKQAPAGRTAARQPSTALAFAAREPEDGGTRGIAVASSPPASRGGRRQPVVVASREAVPSAFTPGFGQASDAQAPAQSAAFASAEPVRALPSAPPVVEVLETVPQPPRRPGDLAALIAAAPLPPERPMVLAALAGSIAPVAADLKGQMRSPAANPSMPVPPATLPPGDERAALRVLFEAALTPTGSGRRADIRTSRARAEPVTEAAVIAAPAANVRMVFSSANLGAAAGDLGSGAFRGPAVQPLPILR